MDYKEKYENALERARKSHDKSNGFIKKEWIETIFPELAENEDEKIRKDLIKYLESDRDCQPCQDASFYDSSIAWLEKQGEQNSTPKFKVGDWIVFNNDHDSIYQVEKIENYEYTLRHILGGSMCLSFSHEDMIRAWTIEDAKDGDVLVADDNKPFIFKGLLDPNHPNYPVAHCGFDSEDYLIISNRNVWWTDECVKPATKEQRDLLFQKMHEAGYEWDAEKKELKKIEQEEDVELTDFESALFSAFSDAWQEYLLGKEVDVEKWAREHSAELLEVAREQSPAWSEEDEKHCRYIIDFYLQKSYGATSETIKWLENLKNRVQPQWRPTEEQMRALSMAYKDSLTSGENLITQTETLKSLYNDLKKL